MGISIEESKRNLSYAIQWKDRPTDESMMLAIDTMRKYQKIEQIVADRKGKLILDTLVAIIKVIENENVN